jgi:organic radical activating enzyme
MDLPCKIDWVCVSPKDENNFVLKKGDELKLIFPQKKVNPKSLENLKFKHFFLQPMDGPNLKSNIKKTYAFCDKNKKWNVSLQLHKIAGVP